MTTFDPSGAGAHLHPAATHLASSPPQPGMPHHQNNLTVPHGRNGSMRGHSNGRSINAPHGRGGRQQRDFQFEGAKSPPNGKNVKHVPCKFFRLGQCQAGNACPFSHDFDGEQPCKYFAKGNCKFGPKCANLHVDQYGRVVNRPQKSLAAYNIGGRPDSAPYQQQAHGIGMNIPSEEVNSSGPFTHQIPPSSDFEPALAHSTQTQPYDIPGSRMQYGSPPDEVRLPMSPPLIRTIEQVGLPSSFDSKGSSSVFKHGPMAASVPSKLFSLPSPISSVPQNGLLTVDAMRNLRDSSIDSRTKSSQFGSSPLSMTEEQTAPRMMHSQKLKPIGRGIISASLPVHDEWDDDLFGEQEDYVPSELLNSQIRHKDDRVTNGTNGSRGISAPRDFIRSSSGHGFGSPELGPMKVGSPSMSSPGNSRFMGMFSEQKRNQEQMSGSPYGAIGSHRNLGIHFDSSSGMAKSPTAISGITQALQHTHLTLGISGESTSSLAPTAPRRLSLGARGATDRTISSNSVSQRIDEEPQDFLFGMDDDDENRPT